MDSVELNKRIDKVGNLLNFVHDTNTIKNLFDARNITISIIAVNVENFFIALKLSDSLLDVKYCKANFTDELEVKHLETLNFNYHGFIRDGFFNSIFIVIENHFRQLAEHYQVRESDSIKLVFKRLSENMIFESITEQEKKVFYFMCYLRNTMHNIGLQTKDNSYLDIHDANSIFENQKITLSLTKDSFNSINFDGFMLLIEQVIKLVIRINQLMPQDDIITHRLKNVYV